MLARLSPCVPFGSNVIASAAVFSAAVFSTGDFSTSDFSKGDFSKGADSTALVSTTCFQTTSVSTGAVWGTPSSAAARQDTGAGEGLDSEELDVSLDVDVGKPILASMKASFEGSFEVRVEGVLGEEQLEVEQELVFVDEYSSLEEAAWTGSRTYVQWFETHNGEVADWELNGVRCDLSNTDGEIYADTASRYVRESTLNYLLNQEESLGIWMRLPDAVRLGESFEADPTALAYLLLSVEGELTESSATLVLESVDEAHVGLVRGQASVTESQHDGVTATYEGEWAMEIDLSERRIRHLTWGGTSSAALRRPGLAVEGEGDFEIELSTEPGPAAERALRKKPEYRDVPREVESLGLAVTLPSHWFELSSDEGGEFATSVHSAESLVNLELHAFPHDGDDTKTALVETMDVIAEEVPEMKPKSASSGLGRGYSGTFEDDDLSFLIELYPLGERRLLRVRMYGPADAARKEFKAWTKPRKSMELLE